MEAHSREKTRSGDGVGKRILEMKSSVLGTHRQVFGVKKVKNSHSVAVILPFCRADMAASYLFVGDTLLFCRSAFPYLSPASSVSVAGRKLG